MPKSKKFLPASVIALRHYSLQTFSADLIAGVTVGLVALPQASVDGLKIMPWRRDPVMACLPRSWPVPRQVTPAWLAARPLILNDASTRLHRLTMDWFAAAGEHPRARIELNFNDAIKSLVAAGYGLPQRRLGTVSVIGPLRMDYGHAIHAVRDAAAQLSSFIAEV